MSASPLPHQLRPLEQSGFGANILTIILGAGALVWIYSCGRIITDGPLALGINTFGAVWGILVVNTVHLIGISHVGIAVSAAVRLLRLERWRPLARMAEVVTIIALLLAAVNLLLHVGRPERFLINPFLYGRWHSPQVWSLSVFALYFMASAVYLYLSMRRDLALMARLAPRFNRIYRWLAWGYRDTPQLQRRHERTLFWLALCLLPIMVAVHSVYGLLFGTISAQAGWYNPLQAPYFVLGAVVSGFSMITVVAALLRRAYAWEEMLTDDLLHRMGGFLAFVVFLYLYFIVSEHLTGQYLPTGPDNAVSSALLFGRFFGLFWVSTALGLFLPLAYLLFQTVTGKPVRVGLIAAAALLINLAMWIKRYLLIVSAQLIHPLSTPRPELDYLPTPTEWIATMGTYLVGALVFVVLLRLFPLMELPATYSPTASPGAVKRAGLSARRVAMLLALTAGVTMLLWGIWSRDGDFAPPKWLAGFALLVAIPPLSCLMEREQ